MTAPVSSRAQILARIRTATARPAIEEPTRIPREYCRSSELTEQQRVQLMADRLREYDADVLECAADQLMDAITSCLRASGRLTLVVPPGLDARLLVKGFDWKTDDGLELAEIEQCDGVITEAFAGVADSGTIILHHSRTEGRRILTLLPDYHLCILRAQQIVATLPEYFHLCVAPPQLATYISGPSATADIEMTRIKGVHGPRFLQTILVR